MCAKYGFKAIEVFMEDLEYAARALPAQFAAASPSTSFSNSTEWDEQRISAASYIYHLCDKYNLEVICLQPFMHYDGLIDREQHDKRIQELHFWIKLANCIGTDLIQIPSSFLPKTECTADRATIVSDLQQVADIGLSCSPPIRFAYEALCWGTHIDLWDQAWAIVQAVDRPNFGTCLDTFNIAGRVYADPSSPCGRNPLSQYEMQKSIKKLRTQLDISKVFYVEVCDGERLEQPISPTHEWYVEGQKPRMTWSRNARLFPYEAKGYLPVMEILEAIVDRGYHGYIAFELFSRTANSADESVPEDHARRGQASWTKIMDHLDERERLQGVQVMVEAYSKRFTRESQQQSPRL